MEILSFYTPPCSQVLNLKWKVVARGSNSCQLLLPSAMIHNRSGSLRFSGVNRLFAKDLGLQKRAGLKVFSGNYNSYVAGAGQDVGSIVGRGESAPKIMIPGLPSDINGGTSAPISSGFWEWKPKLNMYYETAGAENVKSPAVLFLPGFGVGSFHYEKQLKDLGRDYRVWAIDFLGQGMSLPLENPTPHGKELNASEGMNSFWGFGDETEPWASELVFSMDLWRDQVSHFIQEVIGEPVYVVGNSLGGFVALYFAASNPQLVKGVTLLNATPFWGFLPNPVRSPRLARLFPWSGTFPLPATVRRIVEILWQKISDPESIAEVLKHVYADHSTNIDKVFSRIIEITQHPAAAASLASIMFAPQGQLSFRETLSRCKTSDVPICLMYGKEDPWVTPVWGLKVKRQIPEAPYYEISPAGHCPHDEVPEVVNYLLRGWIKNLESQGSVALPLIEDSEEGKKAANSKEINKDDRQRKMRLLSETFRSIKPPKPKPKPQANASKSSQAQPSSNSKLRSWCVYLILSTNTPIKTYVGVTNNFSRRLKQHNGELKGGAKASRAGRPWVCACLIRGFDDRSEASQFESKWKSVSRKLPRKKKAEDSMKHTSDCSLPLLQHRQMALDKVKGSFDFSRLEIDWPLNSF
ncbi:hypothetical protein Tsubulata_041988 [Turnera subulata]|uniref:GIY-YIG domain-containing protein n=1 Tax=Turnera subulata TaxID=218843 RepID=A0A9Q0JD04_9ROSI|nr:hypothetical protein Tsubulata_041988 [Turnera subulata]